MKTITRKSLGVLLAIIMAFGVMSVGIIPAQATLAQLNPIAQANPDLLAALDNFRDAVQAIIDNNAQTQWTANSFADPAATNNNGNTSGGYRPWIQDNSPGGYIYRAALAFNELLDAVLELSDANIVGCDIVELAPHFDHSGASTSVACKLLREMVLAYGA